jgi:polysaccharide export outer membrane protein
MLAAVLALAAGCQSTPDAFPKRDLDPYREVRLREGDSVKVSFPGTPNLDSTQIVRRDGKITVTLGGEADALGKTPAELQKEILDRFGGQLAVSQVVVTPTSSSYPVFVTGAVLRPGKITADHPISALEAVMEAGGLDYSKANLKAVTILRQVEGQVVNYRLNLRDSLKGPKSDPFYLKPSDIVYVPEKFTWF